MLDLLATQPGLFVGVALLFGLLAGSFFNVVGYRLPRMLDREWREQCTWLTGATPVEVVPRYNLLVPRSACPHCGHVIAWFENIPIFSWLFLRGRCSNCQESISVRYPIVEASTGLLYGLAAWHWGFGAQALFAWVLLSGLIVLSVIDLDTQLLPDVITLPLAWMGLLVNLGGVFAPLDEAVLGGVVGYGSLWLVYQLFKLATGKEGMGFGDFKLLSALGCWLGWKLLLPVVLMASLGGALIGILLIVVSGRDQGKPLPFGPWLALGGGLALFLGDGLLKVWLG